MPDLPPLVGHLKADAGDWDSKMAMVSATGGEAAAVIDILHEAYDGARDAAVEDAEANHMLRDATAETATVTELLSHLLDVARDHALENAASNAWLARSLKEIRDASVESTAALEANSAAKSGNAAASTAASVAGLSFMQVLVGIGVVAGVALAPIAALSVGFLGAVTTLGLFVGGVGIAAAAMIALGVATGQHTEKVKDAQGHIQTITVYTNNAARAWAGLVDVLHQAGTTLGNEVAPMAALFIGLLAQLVPIAVQVVQPMIHAFQLITPALLPLLKILSTDFLRALGQVGLAFAVFASDVLARQGNFQSLFALLTSQGVQAIVGLLDNLLRLSDWFFRELPALGGPTGGFFSLLGTLVQGAASIIARFAEWVGQHWPEIASTISSLWGVLVTGFQFVAPVIGIAVAALQALGPVIQFIKDHGEELKPILLAIGGLAAIMAASFLLTVGSVILVVGALVGLFLIGDKVVNWLKVEVPAGIRAAGAGFSALGAAVHGFINGVGAAIGGFFSGLGSMARGAIAGVGAAFSGLGSAVHGTITAAWNAVVAIFQASARLITTIVTAFVRGVVGWFEWLYAHNYYFQRLVDFIRTTFFRVRDEAVAIWTAIGNWLAAAWAAISEKARSIWTAVTDWLAAKWAWVYNVAAARWTQLTDFIGQKLNDAWSAITSVWNRITGWLGGVWSQIAGAAGYWWGVVASAIGTKVHEAWNTITGIFGGLGGWFSDRSRDAFNWGYNLIQNIGRGIGAAAGIIANAVRQIGGVIADWLGFHSPTKLGPGAEADMWAPAFIRMYAGGLRAGTGAVRAAAGELAAAVAPPIGGVGGLRVGAGAGLAPGSAATSPADGRTLELHTHVHIGDQELAHIIERFADGRVSRLLQPS